MTISTTRAVERCERLAKLGPPSAWWRVFKLRRWLREYRAIMALDISAAAEILRSVYSTDEAERAANRASPTFGSAEQGAEERAEVSAPCLKCGAATEHRVEFTGLLEGEVFMCEGCFGPAMADFEERRRQFQELIDAGVPRASANFIMIGRIDEAAKS